MSTVLLTGGTGLIGGSLLPELLAAQPDRHVFILSRNPAPALHSSRVTVLAGDITNANLSFTPAEYRRLTQSVTEVIHCAAGIRFTAPLHEARAVNAAGTRHLLDFAARCPKLEKFAHVSTLYIAGKRQGAVAEGPLHHDAGFFNSYEQSKYEAEQLVLREAHHLPTTVFRLSSVIGHSVTGHVAQFNYFHQLLRLVPRNPLEMIPGEPGAPVDLIASDWAPHAMSRLYERHFTPGSVFHICAGPQNSMCVSEIVDRTFAYFSLIPPRLVTTAEFQDYSRFLATKGQSTRLLDTVCQFLPHLALKQSFENAKTLDLLDHPPPDIRSFFEKVIASCMRTFQPALRMGA